MDLESGIGGSSSSPNSRGSLGTSNATTIEHNTPRQRMPRSLPPWIGSFESDQGPMTEDQMKILLPPKPSVLPQHNHSPAELERRISKDGFVDWVQDPFLDNKCGPRRASTLQQLLRNRRGQQGRKWDHLRTAEPVIVAAYGSQTQTQAPAEAWRHFLKSSVYGAGEGEDSEVVDPEMLDKLQPGFNRPVENPLHPHDPKSRRRGRRRTLGERIWRVILRHSLVPLVFRLVVLVTSLISMSIAVMIYLRDGPRENNGNSAERSQSIMAITVDVVAVPYIVYMIWDEYTGKPLGLRPATQKIALILLDLFFIIFKSASTALAFESLVYHNNQGGSVERFSRALAAFMFVGLLAWTMNFMVNIFRTVARLGPTEEAGRARS